MNSSNLWNLNWKDLIKGLITAVIMGVLTIVYEMITAGGEIDLKKIGIVALGAGIAYLIKNFSSDKQGNPLGVKIK